MPSRPAAAARRAPPAAPPPSVDPFADTCVLPVVRDSAEDEGANDPRLAPQDADEDSPLFRPAVIEGRRPQMAGEVLLSTRAHHRLLVVLGCAAALALVALLVLGSYTRRATVAGYLAPDQGVVRLYAPATATVLEQRVREGQDVAAGQVLYLLGTDRPVAGGGTGAGPGAGAGAAGYQAEIAGTLEERRRLLEAERATTLDATQAEVAALQRRAEVLRREAQEARRQLDALQQEVQVADEVRQRWRGLQEQGLVTRDAGQTKEREWLDLKQRAQSLAREALALQRQGVEVAQQLEAARARVQTQQQSLGRELASLREAHATAEARRQLVITAPHAGRATLVQGLPGSTVDTSRPLLTLLPAQVTLQALLYAPSRTVGFVRPGTEVWLRHEAYAYQKYGHQKGVVTSVSTFPADAGEVAGLAAYAEAGSSEPLYAITVRLDAQSLPVDGQAQPLRPGLRVQADLMMERRHLYEWMLEPLYALRRLVGA